MEHGSDELFSSDSEVKIDEDTLALGGNSDARKNQDDIWSRPYRSWNSCGVGHFIGGPQWTKDKSSTPCKQKFYNYNLSVVHTEVIC